MKSAVLWEHGHTSETCSLTTTMPLCTSSIRSEACGSNALRKLGNASDAGSFATTWPLRSGCLWSEARRSLQPRSREWCMQFCNRMTSALRVHLFFIRSCVFFGLTAYAGDSAGRLTCRTGPCAPEWCVNGDSVAYEAHPGSRAGASAGP